MGKVKRYMKRKVYASQRNAIVVFVFGILIGVILSPFANLYVCLTPDLGGPIELNGHPSR
jgi:uncharacterized membrane protein